MGCQFYPHCKCLIRNICWTPCFSLQSFWFTRSTKRVSSETLSISKRYIMSKLLYFFLAFNITYEQCVEASMPEILSVHMRFYQCRLTTVAVLVPPFRHVIWLSQCTCHSHRCTTDAQELWKDSRLDLTCSWSPLFCAPPCNWNITTPNRQSTKSNQQTNGVH